MTKILLEMEAEVKAARELLTNAARNRPCDLPEVVEKHMSLFHKYSILYNRYAGKSDL